MEEKTLPTKEYAYAAYKKLLAIGYRRMTNAEILEELREKKKISTSVYKGKEYGFTRQYVFELNTFRVEVNTNYSDAIGALCPKRRMSIFLKDSRTPGVTLTSFDIKMTEAGLDKMVEYAFAFADIVIHWPVDPECGHKLSMGSVPGVMHVRVFTCKTREPYHIHKMRRVEVYFTDILGISDRAKKFLDKEFDRNAYFTKWQKTQGKNPVPLRVLRAEKLKQKTL